MGQRKTTSAKRPTPHKTNRCRCVRTYERPLRHATRRDLTRLTGELCDWAALPTPEALRPTGAGAAAFTDVGSANVRSQVTTQPAPFMRKSSVCVAHRGSGPGRFSRIMDAAARRSHPSTRHLSDASIRDPSWSAPETPPGFGCLRFEAVGFEPTVTQRPRSGHLRWQDIDTCEACSLLTGSPVRCERQGTSAAGIEG
jgi:hypothetical protein